MEEIRNLPIGIQSFVDIRERGCVYVDKTQFIPLLLSTGKQYFLSRPRRFGKSLFVSMLKAYFQGKQDLFTGLEIETLEPKLAAMQKRDEWISRPVFHLDLSGKAYNKNDSLETLLAEHVSTWEKQFDLPVSDEMPADIRFRKLIRGAYEKTGLRVAVLIDEYDKPLVDNIDGEELMDAYRVILKGFYGVLKPLDEYLHFVFITGITRFDKVSIFSDLNHLCDISHNKKFNSICGVTQKELEENFAPEIAAMANENNLTYEDCVAQLKQKYDGYHFVYGGENIYNPFSLINAFFKNEFGNYWFETGTPTFLVKMLRDMNMDAVKLESGISVPQMIFENYHIDTTSPEPLLYQTGYLTIKDYKNPPGAYTLVFPNDEVKFGFLNMLLPYYIDSEKPNAHSMEVWNLYEEIYAGDVDSFMERIKAIIAGIPPKTSEKLYELDCKVIFYLVFKLLGQFVHCEVQSAKGRSDSVVWTDEIIYVFEFKLDGTADEALAQIDDKGYAIPYQADGRKIVKVGAVFSSKERNLTEWKVVSEK